MKYRTLTAAFLTVVALQASAQSNTVDYQYKNNTFSIAQQDKIFTKASTGKVFYTRVRAFDSFSRASLKPFVSRDEFIAYLNKFGELPKIATLNGYGNYEGAINILYGNIKSLSKLSTKDDHRFTLYSIMHPVYKVIEESWGEDIINSVLQEAYLNLYEYTAMKENSGEREFVNAMTYINMDPIKVNEAAGTCEYTVSIDKPVLKKDDIEVYFCDMALFRKISRKYSGALLEGPINGWQAYEEESDIVRNLLQAYEGKKKIPAYYSYGYKLKDYGNPATVQQNLLKGVNWFVWVFRNGKLYYSYMALPCADLSKITVYEERIPQNIVDPNAPAGGQGF